MNDRTKKIKEEIKKQYGSIRKFCEIANIPSTTLTSALSNDIGGMGFDKVAKICEILNLDILTFDSKKNNYDFNKISNKEEQLLSSFHKLNTLGQEKAIERIEELTEIPKYQISYESKESNIKPIHINEDVKEQVKIVARGKGVTTISKEDFERIKSTAKEIDNIDDYF